ncbi:MAG: oligosaccharide flippase family protein [Shewanella sp.]|nr:oligosaccharide flippase family protein [Shewanella sp.]
MKNKDTSLTNGTLFVMCTFIGGFIVAYAFNVVLSRLLGPTEYGNYKVAEAFISLGSLIAVMGGAKAAIKFLTDSVHAKDSDKIWEYIRFYTAIIFIVSGVLLVLVYVGHQLHFSIFDGESYHPILVATLIIPFSAISALLGGIILITKNISISFLPWRVGYPGLRLLFCGLYFLIVGHIDDVDAVIITLLVSIILIMIQIVYLRRESLLTIKRSKSFQQPKQWLSVSMPLMLIVVMQAFINQIDIYMIEFFSGETAVGHFAASQTTTSAVNTVRFALYGMITPFIVPALKGGFNTIAALNYKCFTLMIKTAVPVALIITYFGHPILELFGHDTELAHQTLITLTIGAVINSLLGLAAMWLQYSGKERVVMIVLIISIVINTVLNALLIPILEIEGAAIATAISISFSAITLTILMYRHTGILPWTKLDEDIVK